MMLGVVVAKVSDARLPVDETLTLACVIAYPIKPHVDRVVTWFIIWVLDLLLYLCELGLTNMLPF